jgi:hypothetical protein
MCPLDNVVTVKNYIEKNKVMGKVINVISLSARLQNRLEKLKMVVHILYLDSIITTCGKRKENDM